MMTLVADERETKPETERGLECRKCGCRHMFVVWTRHQRGKIVRRRECRYCGTKITTFEREAG